MNANEKNIVPIELLTKYFAGEASTEEHAMVDQWKQLSEDNRKEYEALEKLWNNSAEVAHKETIDVDAEWNKMLDVISPTKTRSLTVMRVVRIAAAVIVISGLAIFGIKQTQTTSFKTTIAEAGEIELPDGSKISLNAKSKITYSKDFGQTNRQLTLKGEGYFEVTGNANLPFVVNANEAQIKVVGTQFNIKAYKNQPEVKVTVTEGTVQFSEQKQPAKKTILKAGETGTYNRTVKAIKKKPVMDENDIAWKTKIMRFENTPLSEVVEIIKNTYHIEMSVTEEVKDCKLTVEFEDLELQPVLKVLGSTLDLTIRKTDNKYYISGNGC
jgi:ferric-dicitrate binding protein FerR (iron transport regulator)